MQAVIMAGGKGTRLASVTQNIPKSMVLINGKPLLEHQIKNLRDCGVDSIILVIGYLGEAIKEHFGDGKSFGVFIDYFYEETPLGTAGALSSNIDRLEENFILVFGDLYFNVDFERFITFHLLKDSDITLFAHPNSHPYDSDIILVDKDEQVVGWLYKNQERPGEYWNLVNAGIYVIKRCTFLGMPEHTKLDLEKDIIVPMIPQSNIYVYRSTEYVKDIGTPERLQNVVNDAQNGVAEQRNMKNKQKCIFLDRDGTINKNVGFLRRTEQLELEQGAAEAIKRINSSGYLAIVITNQPVVARGETTKDELERIHKRLHTLLGTEGAYLDGLYFCPHHPDKGFSGEVPELKIQCDCRKPKTGLLRRAERDFNIDLGQSWFVGDTDIDIQTGISAGCRTALICCEGIDDNPANFADIYSTNLLEAIEQIMEGYYDHGTYSRLL